MPFSLLLDQRLVWTLFGVIRIYLWEIKENIAQATEKLLGMAEDSEELDLSWWMTFLDVPLLLPKENNCETDEIVIKKWP